MVKGLPKSYIKKYGISKRAWREYRKVHPKKGKKSKSSVKSKSKSKKKGVSKTTKKKSRRRGFSTATVFKFIRLGALLGPAAYRFMKEPPELKVNALTMYGGLNMFDGKFRLDDLKAAWTPFIMASLATVGIGKLNGIIRSL